jgi:hypothetical protein
VLGSNQRPKDYEREVSLVYQPLRLVFARHVPSNVVKTVTQRTQLTGSIKDAERCLHREAPDLERDIVVIWEAIRLRFRSFDDQIVIPPISHRHWLKLSFWVK